MNTQNRPWKISLFFLPVLLSVLFFAIISQLGPNGLSESKSSPVPRGSNIHSPLISTSVQSPSDDALDAYMQSNIVTTTKKYYQSVRFSSQGPSSQLLSVLANEPASSTVFEIIPKGKTASAIDLHVYNTIPAENRFRHYAPVKKGETFAISSICSGNAQREVFTLDRVTVVDGRWRMELTKKQESRSEVELGQVLDSDVEQTVKNTISLSKPEKVFIDEGGFSLEDERISSVLRVGYELLIPIFVSENEIIFYLDRRVC